MGFNLIYFNKNYQKGDLKYMLRYDLHIHSCLSPCADNDMTPANIAGFAKLEGLDVIAVTDHNSTKNLPFVYQACKSYDIKLIFGIEVTSQEEAHILCYFNSLEKAMQFGDMIYDSLPNIPCKEDIFGNQFCVDTTDNVVEKIEKLLINASSYDVYSLYTLAKSFDGICVPAHIDKHSYSILSTLGIMPMDIPYSAVEVKKPEALEPFYHTKQLQQSYEILSSSDAHTLMDIAKKQMYLPDDSCITKLL